MPHQTMTDPTTKDALIARLIRAGEALVSGAPEDDIASYFDAQTYRFHGPDGSDTDFAGLNAYFASVRDAFDDRSILRGIIVVDGQTMACQTWIEGTFARDFTMSPVGLLPPNGARVTFALMNIFKFDDQNRIVEEFIQSDNRSVLRQLGAEGR